MKKLKRLKLALYEVADIKCEMVQVKVVAFSKIDKTKKKFYYASHFNLYFCSLLGNLF